jgi:hypothetical protein
MSCFSTDQDARSRPATVTRNLSIVIRFLPVIEMTVKTFNWCIIYLPMQIKFQKINIVLLCSLLFLPEINIFAQAQVQTQPPLKEKKIDVGRFSDNTAYENANQFYGRNLYKRPA